MSRRAKRLNSSFGLRKLAEATLGGLCRDIARMSAEEIKDLVHKLEVHQVELKLQNEELRQSQLDLAESRDRFNDLYDHAPFGYVTLDCGSKVLHANLAAASLLGVARADLIGRRFTRFIARDAQDKFYLHQKAAVESGMKQVSELLLQRMNGTIVTVQFETI